MSEDPVNLETRCGMTSQTATHVPRLLAEVSATEAGIRLVLYVICINQQSGPDIAGVRRSTCH
jgi:hypothetical protein